MAMIETTDGYGRRIQARDTYRSGFLNALKEARERYSKMPSPDFLKWLEEDISLLEAAERGNDCASD